MPASPPNNSTPATGVAPELTAGPNSGLRYAAVYLIDDCVDDYLSVDSGVDPRQVHVKSFINAGQALRIPTYEAPLLYIVNSQLTDMSGFDLRQMLVERWPHVPGYIISNEYNAQDEIQARCAGSTVYFCKPLSPGWLAAALKPFDLPEPSVDPIESRSDRLTLAWRRGTTRLGNSPTAANQSP